MKYIFVSLLLLSPYFAVSQKQGKPLIDSFFVELSHAKEDTNRVYLLDKLSYIYSTINSDEGIKLANQAMILSAQLKWEKGIAIANADLGINYEAASNHPLAMDYTLKAQKLYEELGNKKGIASTTANIGIIYLHKSNYSKTLECEFSALKIYEELNDSKKKSIILETIGIVYSEQRNYAKATEYYNASLRINRESGDKESIGRNMGNIGAVFAALGEFDSALEYHKMALQTNRENGNRNAVQVNLENIGNIYLQKRDYPNALEYQVTALQISEEMGIKSSIAINLGNIGETYFAIATDTTGSIKSETRVPKNKTTNLELAIKYLENAISICKEINYSAPELEFTQSLLAAYSLSGNYKKAFEALKQYVLLKDTIFSDQNKIQIAGLETQREVEIRDRDLMIKDKQLQIKKLELAQKHNERLLFVISIILFAVIVGIVLKRLYGYRSSNRLLQMDKSSVENKLVHSEFRLKQAQEIAHLGSWEHNFQTGVALWSEEACRIYGLTPDDTVQSYKSWLSFIHPDDLGYVLEMIKDAQEKLSDLSYFHRIMRRDGTVRHLFSQAQHEFNESGKPIGLYGIVHDVTEIKKNEEEIKQSNERFTLVNMATREAIMDWDILNDTTIWGNGFCELFGYRQSDFYNHFLRDNMYPDDRTKVMAELQKTLDESAANVFNADFRFLKANGEVAYVQLRSIFIRDGNGGAIRAVGSVMDVTKMVEKTNEIEKQNVALMGIAWIQSHVVRAPLATLMGLVELLKRKEEYGVDERDVLDKILSAANDLDTEIHHIVNKAVEVEHRFKEV